METFHAEPLEESKLPWTPTAHIAEDEPDVTPVNGMPLFGPTVDHVDPL